LSEFDLRALLELLHEKKVRFIVIGGVAVAAHGYVRGTEDLDLVPDPDPENLTRLSEVLADLRSTLPTVKGRRFDSATDGGVIRRGGNVTADTDFGGLDVVQRARGVPSYTQLAEDAVESDLLGIPVRVCSLARLREMKEAQGRTEDKADLENLPEA
jgi:predicted nucleotidyltransferase